MSLISRDPRRLAVAGLAAFAALGASATSAQAAKLKLNYTCNYPLLGEQPLAVDIDATVPSSVAVGDKTGAFKINAVATAGGYTWAGVNILGGTTIEGAAAAGATISAPGFALGIGVDMAVQKYNVPATKGNLVLNATGEAPSVNLQKDGTARLSVDTLKLNLVIRNAAGAAIPLPPIGADSDGNADTFDVDCVMDPNQSTSLATFRVGSGTPATDAGAPSTPEELVGTGRSTAVALSWAASSDDAGVTGYDVYRDGTKVQTVSGPSATIAGLDPSTSYRFQVVAKDASGKSSDRSNEIAVSTIARNTNPAGTIDYGYDLAGTANIRTLTRGPLRIKGTIAAKINLDTGNFTADLKLENTRGQLALLGLIPVTADVGFINAAPTTGTLKNGVLTATAKLKIRLPQLYLFGYVPVAGPGTCQTRSASTIVLKSDTAGFFPPTEGGIIKGQFAIGELTGCGPLEIFVSPLAAGGGNVINAMLTPKA